MTKKIKKISRNAYFVISAALIVAFGSGIAWTMHLGVSKLPLRQYFSRSYTNAVWDWSDPEAKTMQDLNSISDFMYLHQLNATYVNVGDRYASILSEKNPTQKAIQTQHLEAALSRYATVLGKRHIAVYAAAGDVSWSDQDKQYIPKFILQSVESYNTRNPHAQLAGVEFDVESYNQPDFANGSVTVKSLALTDWLDMVNNLATQDASYTKASSLELGFAIPYWFDNENGNIPSVTWHNQTGPTLYHVLDRLNSLPKSNVVVMDYRNVARGNDGIEYHARTEVDYATAKAPHVHVLIGQELNDVQPAKITYYGKSTTELSSQVGATEDGFRDDSAFAGIAINDLAGFRQMEHNQ